MTLNFIMIVMKFSLVSVWIYPIISVIYRLDSETLQLWNIFAAEVIKLLKQYLLYAVPIFLLVVS